MLSNHRSPRRRKQLKLESLEERRVLTLPYGAMEQDTAEFMLGRVAVTPVLLESNGQFDTNTENWNTTLIQQTLQNIQTATTWWVDLLAAQHSVHSLEFVLDTTYATTPSATKYEPISRTSNDYPLWTQEFLDKAGFNSSGNLETNMRAFNHAQRVKLNTDWAFTIFVVNSTADADGQFASGGSFSRAFAFAGGLFLVSPSTRPASTFAHEMGHQFWAKDEYAGGASWFETRGYYNTQNTNAADNPAQGFVQQASIMAAGGALDTAFANHVSAASTLAMIGWQDSDSDGIFDVLDVPLELIGSGYYDDVAHAYKFRGSAKVGTLANLNPEGNRNDITLNKISHIQYRINAGAWTTFNSPNAYQVDLDLSIPVANPGQTIEIRAIDSATGITSNIYVGRFHRTDAVANPGINGFVWIDANKNNARESNEAGEAGWTIELLAANGGATNLRRVAEPDTLPDGVLLSSSIPGATITAIGNDADGRVGVFADQVTSTGTKTFRAFSKSSQSWSATWSSLTRRMKVEFGSGTSLVEIDAIGNGAESYGRIDAFDSSGNLIDRFTTSKLTSGQISSMRVESASNAIAYVIIGGHVNSTVRLDNLRFGPLTSVTTGLRGQYSLPLVPPGNYQVRVTPSSSYAPVASGNSVQNVTVGSGASITDIDFGFAFNGSLWQNPSNRFDVNQRDGVTALDVLLIINQINAHGPQNLSEVNFQSPPYVDVNGDGFCTALDALQVINLINSGGNGEGESAAAVDAVHNEANALGDRWDWAFAPPIKNRSLGTLARVPDGLNPQD